MAAVELARSRSCVGALGRLGDLNLRMQPLAELANRLRQLNQAIALEDSTQAAPFLPADPLESAVQDWFVQDLALGTRFAATADTSITAQRTAAKDRIRKRLTDAMDGLKTRADSVGADAQAIDSAAVPCQGSVFVRPAVLDECSKTGSDAQLCAAAADTTKNGLFRFVDAPEDLWDIEEYRPWTDPKPLEVTPAGGLGGAQSSARARLGNVAVAVALVPLIQPRTELDSARAAEWDANLDSLGVKWDVSGFVMAPALEVRANLPAPVDGETHYLLYFGEIASPDVVWSAAAGSGGLVQATVPLTGADLNKLQAGEQLSFTAVKVASPPAEGQPPKGEFVYGLSFTNVNQARATGALLGYMTTGQLAEDLKKIIPPTGG